MSTFNPSLDPSALAQHLARSESPLVVCYCAEWCDSCRGYQRDFEALAARWPQFTFVWVDIEENPELLGDDDVENFPTLLIQSGSTNLFFGPLLPYISHLEKLLDRCADLPSLAAGQGPPALRPLLAASQ